MNNIVYFWGDDAVGESLKKGLGLIGYDLLSFNGDYAEVADDLLVYQLNCLEADTIKCPENLVVISSNPGLKGCSKGNIFYYGDFLSEKLSFAFSMFLLDFIKRRKEKCVVGSDSQGDFYCNRESVSLYYLEENLFIKDMKGALRGNRKFVFITERLDIENISVLKKGLLALAFSHQNLFWLYANLDRLEGMLVVCYDFPEKHKKELRRLSPLIPFVFISNFKRSSIRRIFKAIA